MEGKRHRNSDRDKYSDRDDKYRERDRHHDDDRDRRRAEASSDNKRKRDGDPDSHQWGKSGNRDDREESSRSRNRSENNSGNPDQNEQSDRKKPKTEEDGEAKPKEAPTFELSGALAAETNTFNGVVLKYSEPKEAKKPRAQWSLFPFKGTEALSKIPISNQSAFLIGRERLVADIPMDHPSISKQHAVLQHREVPMVDDLGLIVPNKTIVKPYIIDLESANGTFINDVKIDGRRYYELKNKDVLKFGFSSREYVLLNESIVQNNE